MSMIRRTRTSRAGGLAPPVLALAIGLTVLAPCAEAKTSVIIMASLGGLGLPSSDAGKVQRWIEAACANVPGYRWLASARLAKSLRSASSREEACEARPGCVGPLARSVGADLVVTGEVGSLGGGFMVYLRLIEGGSTVRAVSGVLDPAQPGLREAARALAFQLLQPDKYRGTINVEVDVANAWIYLDGKRVARSPARPLTEVGVGTHALRVTHEAYRDFVRFVNVDFGSATDVKVRLSAFPIRSGEMKLLQPGQTGHLTDRELPWYRRWWAVAAFGAVVLAATTTTAALLSRREVSRDSEALVHP